MNTKITANYRCLNDISNFIVRITLKEILNENIIEDAEKVEVETGNFQWQEKKFGRFEKDFYRDLKNCVSDLDRKYHTEIKKNEKDNQFIHSYVNEDPFCLREENVSTSNHISALCNEMTNLRFTPENSICKSKNDTNDLINSLLNPLIDNNYEVMYIIADFGEYLDDTWIKDEYILCTIKYVPQKKLLSIFPDFTIFEPYRFTINGDITKIYEYTLENISDVLTNEIFEKENDILNKIKTHQRKLTQFSIGNNFVIPPNNKLDFYIFLEIVKGNNFEYNNVYVRYFIDLPENWSCFDQNTLKGTTQTCSVGHSLFFGAIFEIALSFDLSNLPKKSYFETPYIYFEVISKDTFDRYRTEGISYLKLPISPGTHRKKLKCIRILPKKISSKLRRIFIGDFMNFEDITWFSIPKGHGDSILNKFGVTTIETGEIEVNLNILEQSRVFLDGFDCGRREKFILEKLGSSTLMKSVEEVLEAFKKARKNMLEAREKMA